MAAAGQVAAIVAIAAALEVEVEVVLEVAAAVVRQAELVAVDGGKAAGHCYHRPPAAAALESADGLAPLDSYPKLYYATAHLSTSDPGDVKLSASRGGRAVSVQ